jgi:hypothetical protein
MSKVWIHNLLKRGRLTHSVGILARLYDKFESPETIIWTPESTTDRRSSWVAQKAKVGWEKLVVDSLRREPFAPEWKEWMCLGSWQRHFPVQSNPCLFVLRPSAHNKYTAVRKTHRIDTRKPDPCLSPWALNNASE